MYRLRSYVDMVISYSVMQTFSSDKDRKVVTLKYQ